MHAGEQKAVQETSLQGELRKDQGPGHTGPWDNKEATIKKPVDLISDTAHVSTGLSTPTQSFFTKHMLSLKQKPPFFLLFYFPPDLHSGMHRIWKNMSWHNTRLIQEYVTLIIKITRLK